MTIFDGVINLDDNQISVIIGFEDSRLRMSSDGKEIGEWPEGEYSIDHNGDGIYTITAENEALQFIPNNPTLFAERLGNGAAPVPEPVVEDTDTAAASSEDVTEPPRLENRDQAPPPKPLTRVAFYALTGVTLLLGLWALASILTG